MAYNTVRCRYYAVNFIEYWVSFVIKKSDLCNVWATSVLYEISRYTGPRYNGTRLYMLCSYLWIGLQIFFT